MSGPPRPHTSPATRQVVARVDAAVVFVARNWLSWFLMVYGVWVLVPFSTPWLMQVGAAGPAEAIYSLYSLFCHQLPERSLFFFGPKPMYTLLEIGQVWPTDNAQVLRQFIGNAQMGWKMAWSDRMISAYGGVWLAGLLYAVFGKRAPRLSLKAWLLIGIVPIFADGIMHMLNDILAGTTGTGFRDTNAWLQVLTGNTLPAAFYAGDQLGTFNAWLTPQVCTINRLAAIWRGQACGPPSAACWARIARTTAVCNGHSRATRRSMNAT